MEGILLMQAPLLACLILTGIHAYMGMHVVDRKVIFVDLSLAQIAALGTILALLLGFKINTWQAYVFSLGTSLLGALLFSLTRFRKEKIPQEAVIGIIYVVSAALAILILHRSPEGDEHIRHMLVGNILLVEKQDLIKITVLYSAVGSLFFRFHTTFAKISLDPVRAMNQGIKVKTWDFLFYALFAVVVTSSVEVAGVLLVFSFLIIPSAAAMLFCSRYSSRLLFGWIFGAIASVIGIAASYYWDFPTGPVTVCSFGALLLAAAVLRRLVP